MIDFAKITKTVGGLDCYYLGQRLSYGVNVHRFAVVNGHSERFCYYNDAGKRIDFTDGRWSEAECLKVDKDLFQIIAPPKIVEVTRWIGYYWDKDKGDVCTDYYVQIYPDAERAYLKLLKITESIEVPNE